MSAYGSQTGTALRMARVRGRVDIRQRDVTVARMADRIVPIFELMARRNQITPDECSAGQRFAASWYGARRQPGLVGAYGDQRWSGTSAGQSDVSALMTEERPMQCAQELAAAKTAINDDAVYKLLEQIVEVDATLEDIGRVMMGYRSSKQAAAAGAAIAKIGLARLVVHYGMERRQRR